MKTNHTPAPWKIRYFRPQEPEQGFFIEAANNNKPELGYGIEIMGDDFGDHCGYPIEQRLADAKLIHCAPELLKDNLEWVNIHNELLKQSIKISKELSDRIFEQLSKSIISIKKATT